MGIHGWGQSSAITGALTIFGASGPDVAVGSQELDSEIRFASISGYVGTISHHTGVTQTADDDVILLIAENKTVGGVLIDATRPGTSMQLEGNYLTGGVRYSEWNWDYAHSDGAARDTAKDKRPLAARTRHDTQACEVSSAGQFTFYNSARDTELAEVTTAGNFEFRGALYCTVGGDKTLLQLEKNTPGSTWAVLSAVSTDKCVLKLADTSSSDGDLRVGTAFTLKGLISATSRTMLELTAGYLILGDTNTNWSGLYIRNGASGGDGVVLEVNGVVSLQAFATYVDHNVPIQLQRYAKASLPTATTDRMIIVSDETGGLTPAFSDGTNWRRVADRAIVS